MRRVKRLLIYGADLLDVKGRKTLEKHDLLIDDGVIKELGEGLRASDAERMDLSGMTIAPGFFNCHTHIFGKGGPLPPMFKPGEEAKAALTCVESLKKLLSAGVTFIRDAGAPAYVDVDVANAVSSGALIGPDIMASGIPICATGGNMSMLGGAADGADQVRAVARRNILHGVSWIKVMSTGGLMSRGEPGYEQMTEPELKAAVEEAHKAKIKAFSHAQGAAGIKNSLRAGVDSIEHGFYLDDWCIEYMKENDVFYVPTLMAVKTALDNADKPGVSPVLTKNCAAIQPEQIASFQRALKAGIKIASGTDAGTPFNPHELSLEELLLFVKYGMTSWEAIEAGTVRSAELCGVEHSLGSIEPGKRACLAVFRNNPALDIHSITDCLMTFKDGKPVYSKPGI